MGVAGRRSDCNECGAGKTIGTGEGVQERGDGSFLFQRVSTAPTRVAVLAACHVRFAGSGDNDGGEGAGRDGVGEDLLEEGGDIIYMPAVTVADRPHESRQCLPAEGTVSVDSWRVLVIFASQRNIRWRHRLQNCWSCSASTGQ
jgi:hypothetical protein